MVRGEYLSVEETKGRHRNMKIIGVSVETEEHVLFEYNRCGEGIGRWRGMIKELNVEFMNMQR